jgi:hypothetical protein
MMIDRDMFSYIFRHMFALLPVPHNPVYPRRWYYDAPRQAKVSKNRPPRWFTSGWFNTLEALVSVSANQEPLAAYLERALNLSCQEHESSMRYGGGYYLSCRNTQAQVQVTMVAAIWLGWKIPKKCRQAGWYYVNITYPEEQNYSLILAPYHAIDAARYHIV